MKQAINLAGNLVEVEDSVPVRTVNGVHYLLSEEQQSALEAQWAANEAETAIGRNKVQAKALLETSDITILRCAENGVSVPTAWAEYRAALRAIVSTGEGIIPNRPAYPQGT